MNDFIELFAPSTAPPLVGLAVCLFAIITGWRAISAARRIIAGRRVDIKKLHIRRA